MKNKVFLFIGLFVLILTWNYFALIPINLRYIETVIVFLMFIFVGYLILLPSEIKKSYRKYGVNSKTLTGPGRILLFLIIAIFVIPIIYGIGSSPLFFSSQYQTLIGEITEENFTENFSAVDTASLPIVDHELAYLLGDKKIGSERGLGSEFYVGEFSDITYNGELMAVAPLEYNDFFKWLNNDGTPGYITVNKVTGEVNLITEINGEDLNLKYLDSSYFGEDLMRTAYLNGNYTNELYDYYFEIDDNGMPYFIIPKIEKTIGISAGRDVYEVIIVDAQTGETNTYSVEEVPSWVDMVYPKELVIEQLDDWGYYVNGFWNTVFAEKDIVLSTDGSRRVANDGELWHYTGLTSVGADDSTVGFVFIDTRTKETIFYRETGATENAAMNSAEGKVQNLGYYATFPIPMNISGESTFFITLKDSKGLVKQYAFVNINDFSVVGNGETIEEARKSYLKILNANNIITENETTIEVSGTIDRIGYNTIDGTSSYYVLIEGSSTLYYSDENIPTLTVSEKGDIVTMTVYNDKIVNLTNQTINIIEDESFIGEITGKYLIYDRTEVCAEALEELLITDNTIYYLPCIKSETIFLINNIGEEITLRYAIDNKLVTIQELLNTNIQIYEEKVVD